jgi:subtilisin family serine protease
VNHLFRLFLLTGFFLAFTAGQSFGADHVSAPAYSTILKQIESRGETTVLVELSSSTLPPSSDDSNTSTSRSNAIAMVQQRLEMTLPAAARQRILHRYEYLPGLAMLVDKDTLENLRRNEMVKGIFENGRRKISLPQSVPLVFSNQNSSPYSGGNTWTVAVLDTGIDKNHAFLATGLGPKVVSEACYSSGGYSSAYPEIDPLCPGNASSSTAANSALHCSGYDGCEHGTHVAGIAAGRGTTFNGVAKAGKIISVQVFTGIRDYFYTNVCDTGFGDNCLVAFDSDILKGLERIYALRNSHKIAAVNMSLGGGKFAGFCNSENALITNAIINLKQAGIATVVASGNNGYPAATNFPACISHAVAVGATSDTSPNRDKPTYYTNESAALDLYAPGSTIYSSIPGGSFTTMQGTSMAAPHVAGAWAVLKHANPEASVIEIENLLKSVGPSISSRNGLVNRKRLDLGGALPISGNTVLPILLPLLLKN